MKIKYAYLLIFFIFGSLPAWADITSGLVGYWNFNDGSGSTAKDCSTQFIAGTAISTGNSNCTGPNPGSLSSNAPTWTSSGVSGDALIFNGTNNGVSINGSSSINSIGTNNQVTISAWIKGATLYNGATMSIVNAQGGWGLFISQYDLVTMSTGNSSPNGFRLKDDNQWHMITGTFDGTTVKLYEDGILMTSYAGTALYATSTSISIGDPTWGNSVWWNYAGSMDNVFLYSRALTASDVALLYGKTPVSLTTDQLSYYTSPTTTPATSLLTATTYPATGVTVNSVTFDAYDASNNHVLDAVPGVAGANNTYTFTWNNVSTGIYSLTATVVDSNGNTSVTSTSIYVNSHQISYVLNGNLSSLQHNGLEFINNYQGNPSSFNVWYTSAPAGYNPSNSTKPTTSSYSSNQATGSACSSLVPSGVTVNTAYNPACIQQQWNYTTSSYSNPNNTYAYTLTFLLTTPDPQTLKIDYWLTNSDPVNTLNEYTIGSFMNFLVNGINQGGAFSTSPATFVSGPWGSFALFSDAYNNYSNVSNSWTSGGATSSPVPFQWNVTNCSTPGGNGNANGNCDSITPGQTYHYDTYVRFGKPTDSQDSLVAPIAGSPVLSPYVTFAQAKPLLVTWPDRRPIARWFIGGTQCVTSTDPRGWCGLDTSSQTNFATSLVGSSWVFNSSGTDKTDGVINQMNAQPIKPQAIEVWDLEGDEFHQSMTYIGNPPQLGAMAPEMNAVADQMFAKIKSAGYKIGMTLRPSNFMTGSTLPSTCFNSTGTCGDGNTCYSDVFVKTTETNPSTPNQAYMCTGPNASNPTSPWTPMGANYNPNGYPNLGWQSMTDLDGLFLYNVTINNGGAGYKIGDQLNIVLSPNPSNTREAVVTVTAVNGGAITGLNITDYGQAYAYPTNTYNLTRLTGSGSGATINLTSNYPTVTLANLASLSTITTYIAAKGNVISVPLLLNLENKVAYAHQRWGATVYYVDSTVYSNGGSFNFNVFRQLEQDFPDCIFMPENQTPLYFGGAPAYSSIEGYYETALPDLSTMVWPNAFTVVEAVDDVDVTPGDSGSYFNTLESSLEQGNILFDDTYDNGIDAIYNAAESTIASSSIPNFINFSGYGLTVATAGSGSGVVTGTVTINSNATNNQPILVTEINCTSSTVQPNSNNNCTQAFDNDTEVTLIATGSNFAGWSGVTCAGAGQTQTSAMCTIIMNANLTATATFNTGSTSGCGINCGDVNGALNGSGQPIVTIVDAELTAQEAIGIQVSGFNKTNALVDNGSSVDINDAFLIAEYAVGKITTFPAGPGPG